MAIKILEPISEQLTTLSPIEFQKRIGIEWLEHLSFSKKRLHLDILKRCYRQLKQGEIQRRQVWLGQYFKREIESGSHPHLAIYYVNEVVGYGVVALTDLAPFTYIGKYTGYLRKRRLFRDRSNSYCFEYAIGSTWLSPYVIDARSAGNYTRFINHSDYPNLETHAVYFEGMMHIILTTTGAISKGTQLCYHYGDFFWAKRKEKKLFY